MQSEPRTGCGMAIIQDERILLIKRRNPPEAGAWGLPGGKIDLFERSVDAAVREAEEELGIRATKTEFFCLVEMIDPEGGTHWLSPVYVATDFTGEPRLCEPAKHEAFDWFALDALPEPATQATREAVQAWMARTLR